ncbi:hypothetical protein ACHAPO_000033 [Fusarium lateritium]
MSKRNDRRLEVLIRLGKKIEHLRHLPLFKGEPGYIFYLWDTGIALVLMVKNITPLYLALFKAILVRGVAFHTLAEQTVLALPAVSESITPQMTID